jgi:hypothetical protein
MLKSMKGWCKLLLMAICMIGLIMFRGDYALAQAIPCVPAQDCLKLINQQPHSQPKSWFPDTKNQKNQLVFPCVPGVPCVSLPTTPPPVKDKGHTQAGRAKEAEE